MECSMDGNPTGQCARNYSLAHSAPHQSLVCKACKHKGDACRKGFAQLKQPRAAISVAGPGEAFDVTGTSCLAACGPDHGKPCVIGHRATERATWLFGDIDPDQPLDDLIAFARDDGRMTGKDLPPGFGDTSLARVPAAMIVTRKGAFQ
jgi:predicted metal-binding protein